MIMRKAMHPQYKVNGIMDENQSIIQIKKNEFDMKKVKYIII